MKYNNLLLIFICFFGILINAQSKKCNFETVIESVKPYNPFDNKFAVLLPSRIDIKEIDISSLLQKVDYLGFIGKNKKRLKINFYSITKMENKKTYQVKGNTIVGKNNLNFDGIIYIEKVYSFSFFSYGVDDFFKGKVKDQGIIILNYEFKEDEKVLFSGIFRGKGLTRWYINKTGDFLYDDIENDSDTYFNNAFIGTWMSYKTGKSQECNWGQGRIPCSGDLDIGAAEFMPNEKYHKYGWEDYVP